MIIFLLGMPGCGKSTVGRELARETGFLLIDLDTYIIQKEKISIPQIFKTKGEDYFRKAETNALNEIISKNKKAIVAVGGGTPCFNNNMSVMLQGGKTIYLKAAPDVLATRIENDITERPLFAKFKGQKLKEKVAAMLGHREKYYKKAAHSIEAGEKNAAALVAEIKGVLEI